MSGKHTTSAVVIRIVLAISLFLPWCVAVASVGGRISGQAKDPAQNAVPSADASLREVRNGLIYRTKSDARGYFFFPALPVGLYTFAIQAPGFKLYERQNISVDTDASIFIDASFQVGGVSETINVTENTVHVDTENTHLGEVITAHQMTAVPLNGRSFTNLLSLQAGIAPASSINYKSAQDLGATILEPSGDLNPGTISINGQRESANFFSVNGTDTEEDVNFGTVIVPNLDAIAEFRIITSNFDAEYGEFSGGQVNVITKSGTNKFHGNLFEFLRNTDLDARNYFSPTRGAFRQNQFGATFGGPIHHDRIFFFTDYQGTRQTQGVDTGTISVPSIADRSGNLVDQAGTFATTEVVNGQPVSTPATVSGPYLAMQVLSPKLGYAVASGEPYYYTAGQSVRGGGGAIYATDCTTPAQCVFPNAFIPQSAWSTPAQRALQFIPAPNTAGGFATSSFNQTIRDDKAGLRIDADSRFGLLSGYIFLDDFKLDDPYPVAQSGANVPGFDALTTGRAQLLALSDLKIFNARTFNELHLSFLRDSSNIGQPVGGRGVSLASQGFENPDGSPSIVALDPKGQSVENLNFNGFFTGAATNQLLQVNNTYQVTETFSQVLGAHSLKFGGELHADQVNAHPIAQFNGSFVFSGTETGIDFADFLIGVPSQYNQSQLNPFYSRNKYVGLFAQDSWHALPFLTVNYGLRWDRIAPWSEKFNQVSTLVPGAQSIVFPGAPAGILYPGDPGIPNTLAPISNHSFAPRIGIAWSPDAKSSGPLQKLVGTPGSSSVRASFGTFYTAIDATTIGVLAANAPYGITYSSPAPPLFATPFITASNGKNNGQPFPFRFAPFGASREHPNTTFDWSTFEPISGIPGYDIHNRTPYTNEWMLSFERQAGPNTIFNVSYVGTSSHRQRVLTASNPGDPALCLSLSQPSDVAPGSATCGPNGEGNVFITASGRTINGTRTEFGPAFGGNALQSTIGHANYNSLQLTARHTSGSLELLGAYTFSKSLDQASNLGEDINPINPAASYALSAFDVKHNFVVSYEYQLPIDRLFRPNRFTRGWSVSGITRFASGFPVQIINNGDNSLLGSNPNGVNDSSVDEPDYTGVPLHLNKNPRSNEHRYFSTTAFTINTLGTLGTSKRRFFYGPGAENFDMTAEKMVQVTESKSLLLRAEAFNLFNHTQFSGAQSVDGNIGSSTFGNAVSAAPARIMQVAAKFSF